MNDSLSTIPALYPNPNGDPPNYTNPPALTKAILGSGIALISMSSSFVVLRFATNLRISRKLHLDDILCLLGLAFGIAHWSLYYSMALDGVARHSWDVPITAVQPTLLYRVVAGNIMCAPALWASKTSILVFYIRLFGVNRWARLACYGACAFAVPVYWSNVIVGVVSCPPRADRPWEEAWVSCSGPGPQTSNLIIGVFSVIFDVFLFAIPFPIIAKLNLKRSAKQGLAIVFMFGFLIIVASVVGLAYRVVVFKGSPDPLWYGMITAISVYAEILGTVAVSCAPALSAFWGRIFINSRLYSSLRSALSPRSNQGSSNRIITVDHEYKVHHEPRKIHEFQTSRWNDE